MPHSTQSQHLNQLTQHIQHWGHGYFGINDAGELEVRIPSANSSHHAVRLTQLSAALKTAGVRQPTIIRFLDILEQQLLQLQQAFINNLQQHALAERFLIAYPIKVNQHHLVVETLQHTLPQDHSSHFGLEAGSKPELLAAIAMAAHPNQTIICNGYKDLEFIQLALISRQMGLNTLIVIEKLSEVALIAQAAKALGIQPALGVRVRLHRTGNGNWQNTGGHKSKFGLNASQLLSLIEQLNAHQLIDQLELLHIHIGSQVSQLEDIKLCAAEAARYFVELSQHGAPLQYFDVGGGLAIDYDGSQSQGYFSADYQFEDYAQGIVTQLLEHCQKAQLDFPTLVIESGRALTAHHAMILTQVIDYETKPRLTDEALFQTGHSSQAPSLQVPLLKVLRSLYQSTLNLERIEDSHTLWRELQDGFHAIETEFFHHTISLAEKAQCEQLFYGACRHLFQHLTEATKTMPLSDPLFSLFETLKSWVSTKIFVNFSLFQAIPDVWGIDQVFPIYPLSDLNQPFSQPTKLYDITCDSDGRVDAYAHPNCQQSSPTSHYLMLPEWPLEAHPDIGIFLTGAYQEILGDIHNLFGTLDAVGVRITGQDAFEITHQTKGDTAKSVLEKVNYSSHDIQQAITDKLNQQARPEPETQRYQNIIQHAINSYTYFNSNSANK